MMLVDIVPSTRPAKKLMAIFRGASGKTRIVHFGARGYKDYTLYYRDAKARARKNPKAAVAMWRAALRKRTQYIARHGATEKWTDPTTPATLARYILWNKPTVAESVATYRRTFRNGFKASVP